MKTFSVLFTSFLSSCSHSFSHFISLIDSLLISHVYFFIYSVKRIASHTYTHSVYCIECIVDVTLHILYIIIFILSFAWLSTKRIGECFFFSCIVINARRYEHITSFVDSFDLLFSVFFFFSAIYFYLILVLFELFIPYWCTRVPSKRLCGHASLINWTISHIHRERKRKKIERIKINSANFKVRTRIYLVFFSSFYKTIIIIMFLRYGSGST